MPPLKITQESALIFPFLNKSDSGTYGCTATSNMGSYKAYYTLNVNGEPTSVPLQHPPSPLSIHLTFSSFCLTRVPPDDAWEWTKGITASN